MTAPVEVPVLLYHSVRTEPTRGYEAWETSPDRLRSQLDRLAADGRTPVALTTYRAGSGTATSRSPDARSS